MSYRTVTTGRTGGNGSQWNGGGGASDEGQESRVSGQAPASLRMAVGERGIEDDCSAI